MEIDNTIKLNKTVEIVAIAKIAKLKTVQTKSETECC